LCSYADLVERCKGVDYLEALQHHENEEIYKKAITILKTYFVSVDEDEEAAQNLAPAHTADGQQLQFQAPQQQQQQQQPFSF
jgi:importin subunit alpha-2